MAESKAFSTINVLSDLLATSSSTGCIVTNGGIGVGGNIFVDCEVNANEIISRGDLKVGADLIVNGNINLEKLFISNENQIIMMKNVVPNELQTLGTNQKRWHNVFANNINGYDLDVTGDILLGQNSKGEPLIKLEPQCDSGLIVNTDLIVRDLKGGKLLKVDRDENRVKIGGDLVVKDSILCRRGVYTDIINVNQYITIEPQVVTVSHKDKFLVVLSAIIIVMVEESVNLILNADGAPHNSKIRIIVKQINGVLKLSLNTKETVIFDDPNEHIDILVRDGTPLFIGGSVCPN